MAEEEKKQAPQQPEESAGQNKDDVKTGGFGLFTWILLAAITLAGLTGGFALAQLLASPAPDKTEKNQTQPTQGVNEMLIKAAENEKPWPYDIDPVIANLDEPGVTRYARVTITIELSPEIDQTKGRAFLDEKKAVLRDWLTTYIAGLNIERVRGTSNLNRIKREIKDYFNELLFPENKTLVQNILFKEFAIQ